jgi:REP element-mobilizing transposase RayT
MPRKARRELPGGLAHVTCRTIRRFPLFRTQRDALVLLDLLEDGTRRVGEWRVLSYCLMPNHVHYVVEAEVAQLSILMRHVNGHYAQRFNREYGYTGHLFQGRFHAKPILEQAQLPGTLRYVLLNPVRAGLCSRPESWRWSSYRALLGLTAAPPFLAKQQALSYFGTAESDARRILRTFVNDALPAEANGDSPGDSPRPGGRPRPD